MTTAHFEVKKMTCSSCVMLLESMEDDVAGMKKVEVNFKQQSMKVDFDEAAQSIEGIVAAVSKLGYSATPKANEPSSKGTGSRWHKLF